nr:immunoglobulin heavy chain junction region [Macaca mulatta]
CANALFVGLDYW